MRVAVCSAGTAEADQLRHWIEQYCALYHLSAAVSCFSRPEEFHRAGPFDLVFAGYGGSAGVLFARALRERDRRCRIVLVDDTPEYAVHGIRLQCSDFLLRPVTFSGLVRSMKLAVGGGAL